MDQICHVMRRCYEKGWITTRDGNASFRKAKNDYMVITPSGVQKHKIGLEDLVVMKVGQVQPIGQKPSAELEMHMMLLLDASTDMTVLHVHPTHVVAAMYAGFELHKIAKDFPELYRYTKVAPNVPKLPATSPELAKATYEALHQTSGYDIVGQAYHGATAIAQDPWAAFEHIERLDHICEIVLKSGVAPKTVCREEG